MAASPDFRLLIAAWVLSAALTGPLDAALNANLALHRGIRLMGWLHASWALGAAFGPAIVGAALLAFGSWRPAFGAIALTWALLGLATARWRPYQKVGAADAPSPAPSTRGGRRELATHLPRPVVIAALLFFFNFGFEISGGQWPFTQLTAGRGLAPLIAGWGAALYWLALTAGRVLLGLAGHRFESSTLLNASSLLAIAGFLAFWLLPAPAAAIVALPALGLGSSVVVPVVYKLLPQRIPSKTATRATGYVAAVGLIGGALIPPAIGLAFQLSGPWVLGPALLSLAVAFGLLQRALAGLRQPGD
jgi:fucose permease